MNFFLHLLLAIVVALGVGFGLSYYAVSDGRFFGVYQVGPWSAWPQVGAPNPDPYTVAYLSRTGTLQLGQTEGIRFVAQTDSDGDLLRRNCTYRVDGLTPVSTFWTMAATDIDGRLISSGPRPRAIRSTRLARAEDGSAVIRVSHRLSPGNWYEIGGEGRFSLVLTLYDAAIFAGVGASVQALPTILNEGCS